MSDDNRSSSLKRTIAIREARIRELNRELAAECDKTQALRKRIEEMEYHLNIYRNPI